MKKYIIALMAFFAVAGNVFAEDKLYVSDVQIPQGGKGTLTVNLLSENNAYLAFQFDLQLPAGISIADPESDYAQADRLTEAAKNWSIAPKLIDAENNIYNFIVYNMNNAPIGGTDGAVLYVTLTADKTLAEGVELADGIIKNAIISTKEQKYSSVDGTFKIEIIEDRVIFNETDTKLPLYTAGETKNVRVTRTLKPDQWNTIVLPFNLTAANGKKLFGDDVKYAQFDGFEVDYGPDEENVIPLAINIKFATYTIPARGNLAGGTPILVKTTKEINTPLELDGVTLVGGVNNVSKTEPMTGKQGAFTGTFISTKIPANGLFINSEQFYYSTGKSNIKGFRGWFMLDEILGQETNFNAKVTFDVDGEATSIDGIPSYQRVTEGVYDLSGRKIQLQDGDLNKLQKGVYIINGKKVTIK